MSTRVGLCLVFLAGFLLPFAPPLGLRNPAVVEMATETDVSTADLERVASRDPIRFLELSRSRCHNELRGWRATFIKRERIDGKLGEEEEIITTVREDPFAIHMRWKRGAKKAYGHAIEGVLFLSGENQGKMTVYRPTAILSRTDVSPLDTDARASSRYAIAESGFRHTLERALRNWKNNRARGKLQTEYLGCRNVTEVGTECHLWRRTCNPPEIDPFLMSEPAPDPARRPDDAVRTVTMMFAAIDGLPLGIELRRADGEPVGLYYYRDLERNPPFDRETFRAKKLFSSGR